MAERPRTHCEMCGKNVPTRTYTVQGARMNLCMSCSKFGDEYSDPRSSNTSHLGGVGNSVIQQRLEKRERRNQTKDIYAGSESTTLCEDYGKIIRNAREKKGMDLKTFAASINEKMLTLSKIESQTLVPDDRLIQKLEKELGIKLYETVSTGGTTNKVSQGGMTLGNFIKTEEKK